MLKPKVVLDVPSTLGHLAHAGGFLRAIGPLGGNQMSPDIEHSGGAVFWDVLQFCLLVHWFLSSLFISFFCVDEQSDFRW